MAKKLILYPGQRFTDIAGAALSLGTVEFFDPVTSSTVIAFKDSALSDPHSAIITLDGSGYRPIWVDVDVDMRVEDKGGNLISTGISLNPAEIVPSTDSGLILNGSFEIDENGDGIPDGFIASPSATSTSELDTTKSTDALTSFRFTSNVVGNGGGELETEEFFVVNGVDDLSVNFDLECSVATVRNDVRLAWYDRNQALITEDIIYFNTATNPTTFTTITTTTAPPVNARYAKIRIQGSDQPGDIGSSWYDRLRAFYQTTLNRKVTMVRTTGGGTWTRPSGCTSIRIQGVGPGGGGAGSNGTDTIGSGGGAGGYAVGVFDVQAISSFTLTGGVGGAAGASLSDGGDGSDLVLGAPLNITLGGGKGGNTGASGTAGGGSGSFSGSGISGINGQPGGDGGINMATGNGGHFPAVGGSSFYGGGGIGSRTQGGSSGRPNSGSGGSGGTWSTAAGGTDHAGGTGANGIVEITEYY